MTRGCPPLLAAAFATARVTATSPRRFAATSRRCASTYPELGTAKLQDVRACDVQHLVDRLVGGGLNPSTVRNALLPLRAICRRALRQGDINANPTEASRSRPSAAAAPGS